MLSMSFLILVEGQDDLHPKNDAIIHQSFPFIHPNRPVIHATHHRHLTQEEEEDYIDVEIYINTNQEIMKQHRAGTHDICPPETFYHEYHPNVYGGYKGCCGEKYIVPCSQDGQGTDRNKLYERMPFNFNYETNTCQSTGYALSNRTYWIYWGNPMDKHELIRRTGINPVVSFPLTRGPYPSYDYGSPNDEERLDDSRDMQETVKDLLVYIRAFAPDELDDEWAVSGTEGTEQGMIALLAAKALEIAETTCNRDIYLFSEVPAYGYSNVDAATIANRRIASSSSNRLYESEECECFSAGTDGDNSNICGEPIITITTVPWFPGTPLPQRLGGDGQWYAADSASLSSPWMESLAFPENPSSTLKIPRLPRWQRRVCDGAYLWPMFFGGRQHTKQYIVPQSGDELPKCSGWALSITKVYSASVRAGFLLYRTENQNSVRAISSMLRFMHSMSNGAYSEWSHHGLKQILSNVIMSRPLSDPTSWLSAYSQLMNEKWTYVMNGFDTPSCRSLLTITNPYSGGYVWFMFAPPYRGLQRQSSTSSFFMDVFGVRTTTYHWGFRGADPSLFYGNSLTEYDFVRLHLFRDIHVYQELARRANVVCADFNARVADDYLSISEWIEKSSADRRRQRRRRQRRKLPMKVDESSSSSSASSEPNSTWLEEWKDHVRVVLPRWTEEQLSRHDKELQLVEIMDDAIKNECAPEYNMDCLFEMVGSQG